MGLTEEAQSRKLATEWATRQLTAVDAVTAESWAVLVDKRTLDLMTSVSELVGGLGEVGEHTRHDLEVLALFERGVRRLLCAESERVSRISKEILREAGSRGDDVTEEKPQLRSG